MRCGSRVGFVTLLSCLAAMGACTSITDTGSTDLLVSDGLEAQIVGETTFLTMRITPSESMDALFRGPVVADEAGCLRLDSPDPATVVWPEGTESENDGGAIRIVSAAGDLMGRVGEEFSLGGGEVPTLPDGLGFTQGDRDLAEAHCPGRYWIVSPD